MSPADIPIFLVTLIVIAVCAGLIELPCDNAQCAQVHRTHRKDEHAARLRKAAHQTHLAWHTPAHPARGCEWCES